MKRRTLIELIRIAENTTAGSVGASAMPVESPGVSVPSRGERKEKRPKKAGKPVKK